MVEADVRRQKMAMASVRQTQAPEEELQLVMGNMRSYKAHGGIDIHMLPLFMLLPNGQRSSVQIDTPVFESFGIYSFATGATAEEEDAGSSDEKKDARRRSLKIEKGSCPGLEKSLQFINERAFAVLLRTLKACPERVPPFCRRLLQPSANMRECSRQFYANEEGHWFKLANDCLIFNADTGEPMDSLPGEGFFKVRLRIMGYYLGPLGSGCEGCCSLSCKIEQVAVKATKVRTPQSLVLDLSEFAHLPAITDAAEPVSAMLAPPKLPAAGSKRPASHQGRAQSSKKGKAMDVDLDIAIQELIG